MAAWSEWLLYITNVVKLCNYNTTITKGSRGQQFPAISKLTNKVNLNNMRCEIIYTKKAQLDMGRLSYT